MNDCCHLFTCGNIIANLWRKLIFFKKFLEITFGGGRRISNRNARTMTPRFAYYRKINNSGLSEYEDKLYLLIRVQCNRPFERFFFILYNPPKKISVYIYNQIVLAIPVYVLLFKHKVRASKIIYMSMRESNQAGDGYLKRRFIT